jgi:hypothetical protein
MDDDKVDDILSILNDEKSCPFCDDYFEPDGENMCCDKPECRKSQNEIIRKKVVVAARQIGKSITHAANNVADAVNHIQVELSKWEQ